MVSNDISKEVNQNSQPTTSWLVFPKMTRHPLTVKRMIFNITNFITTIFLFFRDLSSTFFLYSIIRIETLLYNFPMNSNNSFTPTNILVRMMLLTDKIF